MSNENDLLHTLDQWLTARLETVHTVIPAAIEQYHGHKSRLASVRPLVSLKLASGQEVDLPIIENVPVVFPGSSSTSILFPLKRGDGVLLLFSESGIGNFLDGNTSTVSAADDQTRFSLTDAIAIPGLWPTQSVPTTTVDDGLVVQHGDKFLQITDDAIIMTTPKFILNGDLEVGGEVSAMNDTLPVHLSTHVHPTAIGPTAPPTAGS